MRGLLLAALVGLAPSSGRADAGAGKALFARQCAVCHSVKRGEVLAAPSLAGVFGRKAGSVPSFPYSSAMKAFGRKWDAATLDAYLTTPGKLVPRTNMAFAGVPDAAKRADLVAYIGTLR